jgi:hypothetical protein
VSRKAGRRGRAQGGCAAGLAPADAACRASPPCLGCQLTAWRRRPCGSSRPSCIWPLRVGAPCLLQDILIMAHPTVRLQAVSSKADAHAPGSLTGPLTCAPHAWHSIMHAQRASLHCHDCVTRPHLFRSSTRCSSSAAAMVIIIAASWSDCDMPADTLQLRLRRPRNCWVRRCRRQDRLPASAALGLVVCSRVPLLNSDRLHFACL